MISTALRTGTPLPQITPCPLLDRFVVNQEALIAARGERETDYNIPQNLTIETLENEQYLYVISFLVWRVSSTKGLIVDVLVLAWPLHLVLCLV